MIPSILLRKFGICVSLVAALGLATFASTASAQANGAQTFTQVDKNVVQVMPTSNPCTGVPGTLTVTFNDIFHLTVNETGGEEATLAITGSALFVPDDPSQPTYTGQFTLFFGHEINLQNEVERKTSNIEAVGSDGSHLNFHENADVTKNANGVVTVSFDKLFCG
jgi:hypothetical protein